MISVEERCVVCLSELHHQAAVWPPHVCGLSSLLVCCFAMRKSKIQIILAWGSVWLVQSINLGSPTE